MAMESVNAILKDPRRKKPKKPKDANKVTGIQNAIQRRIANGSYGRGRGRTSGEGFKAGPTVGTALAQRKLLPGDVAKLGAQGNQSAAYAAALKNKNKRRGRNRQFFSGS